MLNIVRYHTLEPASYAQSLGGYLRMPDVIHGQIFFPLMLMCIYWISGYYNNVFSKSRIESLADALISTIIGTVLIYFIAIFNDPIPDRLSNFMLLGILEGLLFFSVGVARLIISSTLLALRSKRKIWRNAVVVGTKETVAECVRIFNDKHPSIGLKIVEVIVVDDIAGSKLQLPDGVAVHGVESLRSQEPLDGIDLFIVAVPDGSPAEYMDLLRCLYRHDKPIFRADWYQQPWPIRSKLTNVAGVPLTDISSVVISDSTHNIKRVVDVVVSTLALVVLSPVILAITISVKMYDGGPVFFSQERVGRRGTKFRIYKFRTMIVNAEPSGPELSSANDRRITRPGRFLRKYRLDELPQFWNVIKGEMSLVGPRPEREYYEEQIIARAPEYILLHQLRPGITSWGMVKYGYASDVDAMVRRMRYDIIYLENVSLIIDLKILFYTVNTVFTGKGV